MFAKNCNQVWAEAMNNFTQRQGQQESHEPSEKAGGGKEAEKDQEAEEPELKQEVAQVSWGRLVMGAGAWAQAWGHHGGCRYWIWGLAASSVSWEPELTILSFFH